MEKVENLYRTATAQKNLPAGVNNSDHACAMPRAFTAALDRVLPGGESLCHVHAKLVAGVGVNAICTAQAAAAPAPIRAADSID